MSIVSSIRRKISPGKSPWHLQCKVEIKGTGKFKKYLLLKLCFICASQPAPACFKMISNSIFQCVGVDNDFAFFIQCTVNLVAAKRLTSEKHRHNFWENLL